MIVTHYNLIIISLPGCVQSSILEGDRFFYAIRTNRDPRRTHFLVQSVPTMVNMAGT
jgi:hypothetical protein